MTETYQTILVERRGPVATVALNRPEKRNSIGGPMMVELYGALSAIAADPAIRILVLRGRGADFCPGADVKHYGGESARRPRAASRERESSTSRCCCTRCRR